MTEATPSRWVDRASSVVFAPLRWVERARGRTRLVLLTLYALILSVAAFVLWWLQSLNGLPDVGDPFAGAEFQAKPLAEADNAFPLYREAAARAKAFQFDDYRTLDRSFPLAWTAIGPEARALLERHREALSLWKQATDRPGIRLVKADLEAHGTDGDPIIFPRIVFPRLAVIEAARLEDQGDMAGAWSWYRAVLRAHRHEALMGMTELPYWGQTFVQGMPALFGRWASDPRVDAKLLRRALAEARAVDAAMPSFAATLRGTYLRSIEAIKEAPASAVHGYAGEDQWYKHLPMYSQGLVFLKREPERTRRVLNLLYANWMAHVDDPPARRPKMVEPGVFDVEVDASGQDPSRRLSPENLAKQVEASLFAGHRMDGKEVLFWINREQGARATILIELATQLYEREHGAPPKVYEDLVGPYLDKLPAGAVGPSAP